VSTPDPKPSAAGHADIGARLMLALLCFCWGSTWPVIRIGLGEIPPFSFRTATAALGATTLYVICRAKGRSFTLPSKIAWLHVFIAGVLNIVSFTVLSSFAQMAASTGRVTILAYTMPIWAVLFAWPVLGERPNRIQATALALCIGGIAILIYPLSATGIPFGIVLAVISGVGWAAGTVYLKWAHIDADPMGVAVWQLVVAFIVTAAFMFAYDGHPRFAAVNAVGWAAVTWSGIVGNGIAYGLWFTIVRRLPAATASLGVLSVPVIGVIGSFLLLGEIPTVSDIVGFALIFAASACVLLTRQTTAEATP
jgi:drug/metabolite transporter (DMT)-like permease